MKKISENPPCFTVATSELRYGWGVEAQLLRNPKARKLFPTWRKKRAAERYKKRANQWALRAKASENPKDYNRAAFALLKIAKLKEKPKLCQD